MKTIHTDKGETLKGSYLHTTNAYTINHNPEGVEY